VGTLLLDLPSRITLLVWGSLLFGEFYLDLDLLHTRVCDSIQLIGLFLNWNSIPCKSISHKEFYSWSLFLVILLSWRIGPTRTTGVYLVCVSLPFDLCVEFIVFFVFILFPSHKSRESVKIGPHPLGSTPIRFSLTRPSFSSPSYGPCLKMCSLLMMFQIWCPGSGLPMAPSRSNLCMPFSSRAPLVAATKPHLEIGCRATMQDFLMAGHPRQMSNRRAPTT
jgi:hypothetical protein